MTKEERDVLLRWKKRSDSFVLVRLKAEAVLYASRGVDVSIIAEMVDRSKRTVRDWLANWRLARLCSVVTQGVGKVGGRLSDVRGFRRVDGGAARPRRDDRRCLIKPRSRGVAQPCHLPPRVPSRASP